MRRWLCADIMVLVKGKLVRGAEQSRDWHGAYCFGVQLVPMVMLLESTLLLGK